MIKEKKAKATKADKLIYKALVKAVEEDKLRVYLDYAKVNRPGSPVYDPWETLLPILVPILLGLILIMLIGVFFGLIFIIAMIVGYNYGFKKKLHKRLIERTKKHIVSGYENCDELWKSGGVIFVNKDNKKVGCVSPEGDWKDFVVMNFSNLMVEKKEEAPKEEKKADERPRTRRR